MMRMKCRQIALGISLVLPPVLMGWVLCTDFPLGVCGNWVWNRNGEWNGAWTVQCGWILLCFGPAAWAAWHLHGKTGKRNIFLAGIILLCGIAGDWAVLRGGRAGLAENALAVLNPFTTGYLNPVWTRQDVTRDFASKILQVTDAAEVPAHRHVHPPMNVYLAEAAMHSPGKWGGGLLPGVRHEIEALQQAGALIPPLDTAEMAEAALKILVLFLAGLELAKILLACMLWKMPAVRDAGAAFLAVAFGSNAAVLFCGHYDVFYFFITTLVLFCAGLAVRKPLWSFGAGVFAGTGSCFTLGFGVVGLVTSGMFVLQKNRLKLMAGVIAGGLLTAGCLMLAEVDLPAVLRKCWENQKRFQTMTHKGYGIWAWWNIVDALLFCGVFPCLALCMKPGKGWSSMNKLWAILFGGWLFILFSGGVRGELGRIGVLYLPVLLLAAGRFAGQGEKSFWTRLAVFAAIFLMFLQTVFLRESLKLVLID